MNYKKQIKKLESRLVIMENRIAKLEHLEPLKTIGTPDPAPEVTPQSLKAK